VTRVAAIDIGSNSTRLLVADVDGERLSEVERLLRITRLGDRVDERGELADDAMERVERVVAGYAERASALEAARPLAVATSAMPPTGPSFSSGSSRRPACEGGCWPARTRRG